MRNAPAEIPLKFRLAGCYINTNNHRGPTPMSWLFVLCRHPNDPLRTVWKWRLITNTETHESPIHATFEECWSDAIAKGFSDSVPFHITHDVADTYPL